MPFIWGPEHTEAFNMLKREISTAAVLKYYDPHKPLTLQTDACSKGLGAVLLQDGHPIYFASKALTSAQQNYVAIELEATCCIMGSTKVPSLPIWKSLHFAD